MKRADMQGLSTQDFLSYCIPIGKFVALLALVSVASVGLSYLVRAVGNVVALDSTIMNNTAVSTVTVGYALIYATVVIGACSLRCLHSKMYENGTLYSLRELRFTLPVESLTILTSPSPREMTMLDSTIK